MDTHIKVTTVASSNTLYKHNEFIAQNKQSSKKLRHKSDDRKKSKKKYAQDFKEEDLPIIDEYI